MLVLLHWCEPNWITCCILLLAKLAQQVTTRLLQQQSIIGDIVSRGGNTLGAGLWAQDLWNACTRQAMWAVAMHSLVTNTAGCCYAQPAASSPCVLSPLLISSQSSHPTKACRSTLAVISNKCFQLISNRFKWFQRIKIVSNEFTSFQNKSIYFKRFPMNSSDFKCFWMISNDFKRVQLILKYVKWFQMISNDVNWCQVMSNDFNWFQIISISF